MLTDFFFRLTEGLPKRLRASLDRMRPRALLANRGPLKLTEGPSGIKPTEGSPQADRGPPQAGHLIPTEGSSV